MSPILGDEDRRVVTVLFADIVGFTTLAERLDPEQVRDVTAACFGRLVEEIARRGGTVDKFIGDAVMALFGSPIAHEDDPVRAVDGALAMQAALGEINGELERDHGERLELRIGVNTGEVVSGVRQVGGFHDFTVIGDTVNVASRLQQAASPGAVVVGETTARLVQHAFELDNLGLLELKGRAAPVEAYLAIGKLGSPEVPEAELPLVGRDVERAQLIGTLGRLGSGVGQVLVITGDIGLGKTRLIDELRGLVADRLELGWAEAQATAYGDGHSYRLYASWTREVFREDLAAGAVGPDDLAARIAARLEEFGVPEALPFVLHLLDVPIDPKPLARLRSLSDDEVHVRASRAMRRVTAEAGRRRPHVLVVDDLHLADPLSIEFLIGLLDLLPQSAIMLCVAYRPDVSPACATFFDRARALLDDRFTHVELGGLHREQASEMIGLLLGGARIAPEAHDRLLTRSGGNPLFVTELVRAMVDRGTLARGDGGWAIVEDAAARVPETLQAAVVARVDRLPAEARRVVQTAAVLGRAFSHSLLAQVVIDPLVVERGVRDAIRFNVLRRRDSDDGPGYAFTLGLIQEVVAQTLLVRRRRELHLEVADAIERRCADHPNRYAGPLALHAYYGEDWDRAVRAAAVAGNVAIASYGSRDALAHFERGLDAAERLGSAACSATVALLAGKGAVLRRLGHIEDGNEATRKALSLAMGSDFVPSNDRDIGKLRASLALDLAQGYVLTNDVGGVESAVAVALEHLPDGNPDLARAIAWRAWVLVQRGQLAAAARDAENALSLAEQDGSFAARMGAYRVLTMPPLAGEIGPRIEAYAREAVRLAREHEDDELLFDALLALEVLRLVCLQPPGDSALNNAQEALALAEKLGSAPHERAARAILGGTLLLSGRWDESEQQLTLGDFASAPPVVRAMRDLILGALWTARGKLDEAYQLLLRCREEGNFPHTGIWVNVELAFNRLMAGELEAVGPLIELAERAHFQIGCLACEAFLCGFGGEMLVLLGDPRAADLAERAERAGNGAFPLAVLQAHRSRALLAVRASRWDDALRELGVALVLSEKLGQPQERARTLVALSSALMGRDERDDRLAARDALVAAHDTFARLGAAIELALVNERLSALGAIEEVSVV